MKLFHEIQAKGMSVGIWLAADPRRLGILVSVFISVATVVAVLAGLAPAATLVGPSGGGSSGGPN